MKWLPRTENKGTRGGSGGNQTFRSSTYPSMDQAQWTPDRVMREAMQRVTWVFRCVDAIASNQAKLPLIWRQDDSETGKEILNHPLDPVFNSRSNVGEDSYSFRYRLSAQLLLSSKGVFIEVVRNRAGQVLALILLPPQYTTPIRDRVKFVSGYEVHEPGREKETLSPDRVIWIRKPHPFDPYLALTPLESAGLAIESDWLYKLYNRNFLLNDGRPGGLIVVKGIMGEDDKDELRSRYRGNINTVGRIGVIASDEGADFVDTAISMRDAAYIEGRQLTKEEILMAFGVAESVLANAAGRTFDNAEQERLIFWMETMNGNHLPLIARPFDVLDPDPKHLTAFDTSKVDVIQRAEIKRRDFMMKEVGGGTRTSNEYRAETGEDPLVEGGDEVYILNTYMPIGSTKTGAVGDAQGVIADGRPPTPAETQQGRPQSGASDNQDGTDPAPAARKPGARKPRDGASDSSGSKQMHPEQVIPIRVVVSQGDEVPSAKVKIGQFLIPEEALFEFKEQTLGDYERWETIVERTFQRFFDRQQRVVGEKVLGAKMRQWIPKRAQWKGTTPVEGLLDDETWNNQLKEDVEPLLRGIMQEFGDEIVHELKADALDLDAPEGISRRDRQMQRVLKINETTKKNVQDVVKMGLDADETPEQIAARVDEVFAFAKETRAQRISITEVVAAAASGKLLGAARAVTSVLAATGTDGGSDDISHTIEKMWMTLGDDHVRPTHTALDGKVRDLDQAFVVEDVSLMYPGDPNAPVDETVGCRCALVIVLDGVPLLT